MATKEQAPTAPAIDPSLNDVYELVITRVEQGMANEYLTPAQRAAGQVAQKNVPTLYVDADMVGTDDGEGKPLTVRIGNLNIPPRNSLVVEGREGRKETNIFKFLKNIGLEPPDTLTFDQLNYKELVGMHVLADCTQSLYNDKIYWNSKASAVQKLSPKLHKEQLEANKHRRSDVIRG